MALAGDFPWSAALRPPPLRVVSKIPITGPGVSEGRVKVSANGIRRSQGDADLSAQQTRSTPPDTRGAICSAYAHAARSSSCG